LQPLGYSFASPLILLDTEIKKEQTLVPEFSAFEFEISIEK